MALVARDYAGDDDLRRMQALVSERWRRLGPLAATHVGDLAWWMYQHPDKLAEARIRLWLEDGDTAAFGWLWTRRRQLDFAVHPEHSELAGEVLAWAGGDAERTWALDADRQTVDAILAAGYERDDRRWYEHHARALEDEVEAPTLPRGYAVRTVRGAVDLERRVAVHRAAFHPSRVVTKSYARLMRTWPYRPDLDHVVQAPDGSFAAFCLGWLDEDNRAGLLEPVGTHPGHRRLGLASAVCLATLRALRDRGARHAVVLSDGGSAATPLYESIGMRVAARHVAFRRAAGKGTVEPGV
jgi:ribosomal protein S18 acetylase RimI-like enzyme